MNFTKFLDDEQLTLEAKQKLTVLMYLSEMELITESLEDMNEEVLAENTNKFLKKMGIEVHKGDGLVDYIKQFTKGTGKLVLAAIKGDKTEVKRIANEFTREKFLDFVLKVDLATMHFITGPIHLIDAITGWDIMANLHDKSNTAKSKLKTFYKAVSDIKSTVDDILTGGKHKRMMQVVKNLEANMPKAT